MTLGSLFDGIGGFPLAGAMCGIKPVWSSEIEPFPLRVTAARFPDVKQLGSVTEIDGGEIEPVDIVTFGSPCQDLSVAGKQLGIHEGRRSNLFFEAVRIIREMRDRDVRAGRTDEHIRPRFAVWENVPGAFSSNGGEDFRAVLEALAGVRQDGLHIPRPKKWSHAGRVVGDGWSIAWRVYDAQYWGVPQRRKRIYLVADFAGECAGKLLFEREGVRGDIETRGEAREGTAADAERSVTGSCFNESGIGYWMPGFGCLRVEGENRPSRPTHCVVQPAAFMGGQGAKAGSIGYCDDGTTPTLRAAPSGGNTVPDVVYPERARSLCTRGDSTPCIDRGINIVCYDGRGNGGGEITPTLTGDRQRRISDYTALCVGNGQLNQIQPSEQAGALNCMHDQQEVVYPANQITCPTCRSNPKPGDAALTITAKDQGFLCAKTGKEGRKYIVRRLTPVECARLQGMPDWWCEGLGGSDSAIYKAYGNGLALPCAYDVLRRLSRLDEDTKQEV